LASDDALSDARDLLEYYDTDLKNFMRRFLVDYMGFSENKANVNTGSPPRKTGQRPEKMQRNKKKQVQQSSQHEPAPTPIKREPVRDPWEKKLYKKIMMEVHPDRLDLVSKNAKDKLRRIGFEERIQLNSTTGVLLAIAIHLDIDPDLDITKQRQLLNLYLNSSSDKMREAHSMIGWSWGESIDTPEFRLGIVKKILSANDLTLPPNETILAALLDYI
jgi:hypothetical protein